MHETILNQKIERAINLDGGGALAGDFRHTVDHFISPDRATGCAEFIQHHTTRRRQLHALALRTGGIMGAA